MKPGRICFLYIFFTLLLVQASLISAQTSSKKAMDHSIYNDWKDIANILVSNNGAWAVYEVNPNKGNGILHLVNLEDQSVKTFDRGYNPRFSPESDYLVFQIRPPYALNREARKEKKGESQMPKDSLGIYRLNQDLLSKIPRVESFSVPEKASSWFVLQHYYKKDTFATDSNEQSIRLAKPEGKPSKMVVMNPVTNEKYVFEKVYDYHISEEGTAIAFTQFSTLDDSIAAKSINYLDTRKGKVEHIFTSAGTFGRMILDGEGNQLAFLHHPDSSKIVGLNLHYFSRNKKDDAIVLDTLSKGMPDNWGISNNGKIWFSGDGSKLFFGTAPIPLPEPEDTLLADEKFQLDIWNWQDDLLQPMQINLLDQENKRSYMAIWHTGSEKMIQLAKENIEFTRTTFKGNGDVVLGSTSGPYQKYISWRSNQYRDYYLINTQNGTAEVILKEKAFDVILSPGGKYILWYETADSNIYSHGVENGELVCLTCDIDADFYNTEHNRPSLPGWYGLAGFTEEDESVLIYSRYDIWKIDPAGKRLAINLCDYAGTEGSISFRYRHLEYDDPYIPLKKPIFLEGFNEITKQSGIYSSSALLSGKPIALAKGKFEYKIHSRARDAEVLCWRKEDFDEYPDVYVSDLEFREQHKISDANPQAKDYLWGHPELVHWISYAGDKLDGILYIPEDLDPSGNYPMLLYFYEKRSNRLYWHVAPSPSRSSLNIAWAVSNGYVVFVPDIVYRTGVPGQSAYNAVVSGALAMCDQFSFIDRNNIGIDGHSWGGYQVAWIITRSNIFKAAMAGAPVSNMISSYGGIRWETGMSRMMQYEDGQSRIGGNLWDNKDLYLENSPIFKVPDIETPLLILHNDNDGAVPWYQGIELFVAMRRLEKPAWLLVYNNEKHGLDRWPNRVDLSIRMFQFFDHYLTGAPAPEWMYEGIPALMKGKKNGYELMKSEDK